MAKRKPVANHYYDDGDVLNRHVRNPGDPDGVIAAEKQRMWRQGKNASERKSMQYYQPKRRWPMILSSFLAVVVVIVGAYFLGFQNAQIPIAKQQQTIKNKKERKVSVASTATKQYDSDIYSLSFKYPDNWVVSDTVVRLTVTSPKIEIKGSDGTESGHVVVMIQNQQNSLPGFPASGATASLKSQQLTYKNPSDFQRKDSFMTFLGYDDSNAITKVFLTGAMAYDAGDNVVAENITGGNPLISVSFQDCAKSYCASGSVTPISVEAGSWDKSVYKPLVTKLLESLVIN